MKQELFSLEGRTALVTDSNGGLGRAMALGLCHAGARVAVTGRQPEKNEAIARELGDPTAVFALDVRDEAAVERNVAQVTERFGSLDILVNNAGLLRGGPLMSLSREDWSAVLETHVTGTFRSMGVTL
jgi:NAD(P)-dependent dehydrogenase (short-subunit alcohol dehydrogenase family)